MWALQDNFFAFWDDENESMPEGGVKSVEDALVQSTWMIARRVSRL
jgi:hypothetical protein